LDIINKLRTVHCKTIPYVDNNDKEGDEKSLYIGVDIATGTGNSKNSFVWEPLLVKVNALKAATEAACTILSIDETVRNPKAEQ
jgi:chaperonin GroEL (HSP60 family)